MNKSLLLKQIVAALGESLEVLERAARASHNEATHESSRAESKYDTRGLEAAYLAGGQARQAREIMDSMKLYSSLATRDFAPGDLIDLTALVKLETDGSPFLYFIGRKAAAWRFNLTAKKSLSSRLNLRWARISWAKRRGRVGLPKPAVQP